MALQKTSGWRNVLMQRRLPLVFAIPFVLVAGLLGTVASAGTSSPTLRIGSTGPCVAAVQRQLGIHADGKFGPITRKAVMAFEKRHGLVVDGVVGRQTWTKLRPCTDTDHRTPPARDRYNLGPVKPHVRAAANEIGPKFGVRTIYGYSNRNVNDRYGPARKSPHAYGVGLDFMVYRDRAKGEAIVAYVLRHAARLRVEYVVWRQRIKYPGKPWRDMRDRGTPTANHMDHPHVNFLR